MVRRTHSPISAFPRTGVDETQHYMYPVLAQSVFSWGFGSCEEFVSCEDSIHPIFEDNTRMAPLSSTLGYLLIGSYIVVLVYGIAVVSSFGVLLVAQSTLFIEPQVLCMDYFYRHAKDHSDSNEAVRLATVPVQPRFTGTVIRTRHPYRLKTLEITIRHGDGTVQHGI
ncbi:hypothetical protein D9758_007545 [Tetrapyrgos nigripes]|uniref:Uncharacterized protein n=1 Tax=Tetrapyrgos nigripes TaxID=182062 RepID=A0A8H5G824_9AGAR|nr:hypothetical protein D9758_007545 [Tetrapyrgos nigripes]